MCVTHAVMTSILKSYRSLDVQFNADIRLVDSGFDDTMPNCTFDVGEAICHAACVGGRIDGSYEKYDSGKGISNSGYIAFKGYGKGKSSWQSKWHGARSGGAAEVDSSGSASEYSEERALVPSANSRSRQGRGSGSRGEVWEIEDMPDEILEEQIYTLRLHQEARRRKFAAAQGREST